MLVGGSQRRILFRTSRCADTGMVPPNFGIDLVHVLSQFGKLSPLCQFVQILELCPGRPTNCPNHCLFVKQCIVGGGSVPSYFESMVGHLSILARVLP